MSKRTRGGRVALLTLALVTVAVLCGATILLVGSPAARVRYHEWRMQAGWDRHMRQTPAPASGGLVGYSIEDGYEAYEHHRDRLVELGAVVRRTFVFDHLHAVGPETRDFYRWLLRSGPPAVDWHGTAIAPPSATPAATPTPPSPLELTVWMRTNQIGAWEAMFAERDVPDYAARFMSHDESELSP